MKILITGTNGQVGHALIKTLTEHELIPVTRNECDLINLDQLKRTIDQHQPDLIINSAAYTQVDQAEEEEELAFLINSDAPRVMAEKAREHDIPIIHFSTDYVFDGVKEVPYTETDPTNPLGVYGKSKLAGEQAIQGVGGQPYILRTSWVYSHVGKNFYLTMKRLSQERDEMRVVSDQFGVPTSSQFISRNIKKMISKLSSDNAGIYHLVPDGHCTWYDFSREIIGQVNPTFDIKKLFPVNTDQYPTQARRPKNSVLDNSQIKSAFMLKFDDWKTELKKL